VRGERCDSLKFKSRLNLFCLPDNGKNEFPPGVTVPFRHKFLTSNFILAAEKQSDSDFKSVIKPVNWIIVSLRFGFSKYWMTMENRVTYFSFKPIGSLRSWR